MVGLDGLQFRDDCRGCKHPADTTQIDYLGYPRQESTRRLFGLVKSHDINSVIFSS
jgi:hypothetical protein